MPRLEPRPIARLAGVLAPLDPERFRAEHLRGYVKTARTGEKVQNVWILEEWSDCVRAGHVARV